VGIIPFRLRNFREESWKVLFQSYLPADKRGNSVVSSIIYTRRVIILVGFWF